MSELWRFVYIESHVTLHAKADAQKVNFMRANVVGCPSGNHYSLLSKRPDELTNDIGLGLLLAPLALPLTR